MKKIADTSIRVILLRNLLIPLCTLWYVCAGVAYFLAVHLVNENYDHQLINSADSVSARLESDGENIVVDLPPAAQAILRHNDRDKFFYQIMSKNGVPIFGDSCWPVPASDLHTSKPVLRYGNIAENKVRMARVLADLPSYKDKQVIVRVAETLNSRQQMSQNILMCILLPQIALICLSAFAIWRGVSKALKPLNHLEKELAGRSQLDLTAIEQTGVPSEVRPLVNAINSLFARISQDMETQKRFVANAAHQFRTPLAALKTYVYYAKRLPSDRQMNEVLDKIDIGTERMSHLSRKLLALAKAEPSQVLEKHESVDLNFVVSDVTASFVSQAALKGIDLLFVGSDSPALLIGDEHNLSELAANLVENAVLYTPSGGHIVVAVNAAERIEFSVRDDGPGIPENERERIFERFYRLLDSDAPGSGLGLSIVKEIALAHNARVEVASPNDGRGTIVSVFFNQEKNKYR